MDDQGKTRLCYYITAAIVVILLLIIFYAWHEYATKKNTFTPSKKRVPDNPGNPQRYEYGDYLKAQAALEGPQHGNRDYDFNRGHDHGAGGVSRIAFDQAHGYYSGSREGMMNTYHWDQEGTYQHTADTWGLPVIARGDSRVNYSGYSKENMSVGAHWDTDATYGHTADTLPTFGLSGYYEDVPTASWS